MTTNQNNSKISETSTDFIAKPWARFLTRQVWLLALLASIGVFLILVTLMNGMDLSAWIRPRLIQLALSAGFVGCLGYGIYRLRQADFLKAQQDIELYQKAKLALQKTKRRLSQTTDESRKQQLRKIIDDFKQAIKTKKGIQVALHALHELAPELTDSKPTALDYISFLTMALLVAVVLRGLLFGNFQIPSGSMIPTLQIGDKLIVNQFIYGIGIPFTHVKIGTHLREPKRGEVVVFDDPKDSGKDLIKRIMAAAGERITLCQGSDEIRVNGVLLDREPVSLQSCTYADKKNNDVNDDQPDNWVQNQCRVKWWEKNGAYRYLVQKINNPGMLAGKIEQQAFVSEQFQPEPNQPTCYSYTVPKDHIFVMGDDRDLSFDGRYWGLVPYDHIKGKAMFIWWSEGVAWPAGPDKPAQPYARMERVFSSIH